MKRLAIVGVLSLAACSSSPNLKQFEGTWHYTAGAAFSYHCTSTPAQFFDLEDAGMVIGEDGGVLVATRFRDMQAPCVENFDVKDNVATAQDAGPCDFDAGFLPTPIQVTLTTDTLTLSADQSSILENGEGSAVVIGIPCPAAVTGTLVKQ
jgi:hypothetical protein